MDQDDNSKVIEGEFLPHMPSGRLTAQALRRADVVTAFHTAFQMIGGVPRLALWADHNPTEFYKLYSRLLPSAASNELNGVSELKIVHSLPPPGYNPAAQPTSPDPAESELYDD
jgi:hypothetical protein